MHIESLRTAVLARDEEMYDRPETLYSGAYKRKLMFGDNPLDGLGRCLILRG